MAVEAVFVHLDNAQQSGCALGKIINQLRPLRFTKDNSSSVKASCPFVVKSSFYTSEKLSPRYTRRTSGSPANSPGWP